MPVARGRTAWSGSASHKLGPELFGEQPDNGKPIIKIRCELDIWCFALRKHKNTSLPMCCSRWQRQWKHSATHSWSITVRLASPLSIPTQSMDQIMFGYSRVNDLGNTISCKLDTRDQKAEIEVNYIVMAIGRRRPED